MEAVDSTAAFISAKATEIYVVGCGLPMLPSADIGCEVKLSAILYHG